MFRLLSFSAVILLAGVVVTGCGRGVYGPSLDTPVTPAPRALDELTVEERRAILDRAEVWRPIDTARLDLLAGPAMRGAFGFDASVSCEFDYPDKPLSGVTPKFECAVAPGDVVKVKYGANNGEVFAEVAASRLFWALGFHADRMYPVKVTCLNCPEDPFRVSAMEWHLGRPGNVSTRVYDPAAIERPVQGEDVEVPNYEGWSWRELEMVADNEVGASRAHIDALKLLAAFIQHVDSKPENQGLVCLEPARVRTRSGGVGCARAALVVKDLGSSFAKASKFSFAKMELGSWEKVKVWKDEATCQADLTSSLVGTLSHPRISEAGRRFLADRLMRLSDRQIGDLFRAARVERRNETIDGRPVTVDDWVRVFKAKRAEVADHRCPTT